jgi:alkylhydroperoxidase family enzyme
MEAALRDFRTAPIPERCKAMLAYLEKATLTPEAVTVDDARALRRAGVSKEAAEDGLFIAACFHQLVRAADALDWEVPGPDGFAASARFLLTAGYELPLATRPR